MRSRLLLAGLLGTAALGAGTSAAAIASAPHATPTVVIGSFHGRRPSTIQFSGDATGNIVIKLHWSWGATKAVGHGISPIDNCVPNCASGKIVKRIPTTITFSDPSHGRFTKIVEVRSGQKLVGRYKSDTWPPGAD